MPSDATPPPPFLTKTWVLGARARHPATQQLPAVADSRACARSYDLVEESSTDSVVSWNADGSR